MASNDSDEVGGFSMRMAPRSPSAIRYALGTGLYVCALAVAFSSVGDARQLRPFTAGVYSAAQATRGQQLYLAQCASCHGMELEGSIGPPLTGDGFLSNYSADPLAVLVDRIENTMPFQAVGSLSRQQSIDLTTYILESGEFPAGQAELSDAQLAQIAFPVTEVAAAAAVTMTIPSLPPPEGNVAELMRAIAFPNANIIFNLQINNPSDELRIDVAQPYDYRQWGSTIYTGWLAVDQAAIALTETASLLLTPGRKCQNGTLAPVDRADWQQAVADLVTAGQLAHEASRARDFEAFMDISVQLNEACDSCHRVYRDTGGIEGSIRGDRCK